MPYADLRVQDGEVAMFFLMLRRSPRSTLPPYTPPFRSYPASFERECIKRLRDAAPHMVKELERIEKRLVDLLPVIRRHVYHPDFGGGFSIKKTRSEEHTSELQSLAYLVCRLLLEKKKKEK